eukprot:1385878-Pleurochrysis_carterae.AAC.1
MKRWGVAEGRGVEKGVKPCRALNPAQVSVNAVGSRWNGDGVSRPYRAKGFGHIREERDARGVLLRGTFRSPVARSLNVKG